MKLTYTDGCISTSLDVDGKELNDLSADEQKNVARHILEYIHSKGEDLWGVLSSVYSGYLCECGFCGDENLTYEQFYAKVDELETEYTCKPFEEQYNIIKQFIEEYTYGCLCQDLYLGACKEYGEYENLGHCSCCGDTIRRYTLEL